MSSDLGVGHETATVSDPGRISDLDPTCIQEHLRFRIPEFDLRYNLVCTELGRGDQ